MTSAANNILAVYNRKICAAGNHTYPFVIFNAATRFRNQGNYLKLYNIKERKTELQTQNNDELLIMRYELKMSFLSKSLHLPFSLSNLFSFL